MTTHDTTSETSSKHMLAIRRPVATAMLFLTLIVFGWRSYQNLPINLMPDISYPSLTVRTEYEGAAPEDVEMLVTRPLEELVSIVSGVVEISSISSPGLSEIILEFTWDADMNLAQQEVRDRLDLFTPPREVTRKPVILRYDPSLDPVMRIAITSTDESHTPGSEAERIALTAIRESAQRRLKGDLESTEGIAQAHVKGGRQEEIQVLLDVERLKALGISPQYVATALAQQNVNLAGGRLREGETEYLVRTLNEFQTIEDIANSIIVTPSGVQRRLAELALVNLGARDRETIVHINGREAVAIDIFKEGDANTVTVCNKVRDVLGFERPLSFQERMTAAMRQAMYRRGGDPFGISSAPPAMVAPHKGQFLDRLPLYAKCSIISDQSRFIKGAIREVMDAILLGGILALAVLYLFLQELRSTIIIGLAIPISVIAAFVPMFFGDITLNIMSLGGLALGVGMLVDNSIVVLESIFRCKEEGDGVVDAADRGTREVRGAVFASTLTTICVFLPVAFVEGIAGQLFGDLALTVTFSLSASLLTALYLVPLIASRTARGVGSSASVVWILRAYRHNRDTNHWNVLLSILAIPLTGLRFAWTFIKSSMAEMFSAVLNSCTACGKRPAWQYLASTSFSLMLLPLLVVLFVGRLIVGVIQQGLITLLFIVACSCYIFYKAVGFLCSIVLRVPLILFARSFDAFRSGYARVLRVSLRWSAIFLILVVLACIHAAYTALELGRELMPPMRQGEFGMRMEIRAGARLEETEMRARRFEEIIRAVPEVDSVTVEIGREHKSADIDRGENIAEFTIVLRDPQEMVARQDIILDTIREKILAAAVSDEIITFSLPIFFSFRSAMETQLMGDSLADLRHYGQTIKEILATIPGLKDVELSVKPGYPELIIEMDRELLAARGLSPSQVAQRLRAEIQGDVATRFSRGSDKIDIRVRADQRILTGVDDLRNLSVVDGPTPIPLSDVARLRLEEGPSEIRRIGQRRTVLISANVEGRDLGSVSSDIDERLSQLKLPSDMYVMQSGQRRELNTAFKSLRFALLLAAFLVYVVMACQFESLIQPALVMFAAPLAFIGVIYSLYLADMRLSVMVFLGGIVLMGIVVNDAIILVDYINQLRARGYERIEAIVEAGRVRLRPIIMTTVTSVLGLLPMLVASGEGAEMRQPLALTLVSGLSVATLLTLFIIPMAYYLFGGKGRT